jgi:hypothetical protein
VTHGSFVRRIHGLGDLETLTATTATSCPLLPPMTEAELAIVRRAYAKQVMVPFNVAHPRVEAAFAAVRREAFLGPGQWPIPHSRRYVTTPDGDPVYLYQDLLVGIVPSAG